MPSAKLSKRVVDAAATDGADLLIWDEALKGFGLKVTRSGSKTYIVQYRMGGRGSITKRCTIGRHGSPWTPITAREEAERLLTKIAVGVDPRATEKEQQRIARDLACDSYVEHYLEVYGRKRWRPSTYPTVASNLRRFVVPALGKKPLTQVDRRDLQAILDRLPADRPALPRNIFAHTSRLFSWAVERGDIERSPFDAMRAPAPGPSRGRVLSDAEVGAIWRAATQMGYPFGPLIQMLALTAQRLNEVARLSWSELDRSHAEWVIPSDRAKNGVTHLVPLTAETIRILDQIAKGDRWPVKGFVFTTTGRTSVSGHSRAKARIDQIIPSESGQDELLPWRIHDLRRTAATGLQRLGVRFEVTEAILNHVSGSRRGVAGVYQRHDWKEEKRAALGLWSAHVWSLNS